MEGIDGAFSVKPKAGGVAERCARRGGAASTPGARRALVPASPCDRAGEIRTAG